MSSTRSHSDGSSEDEDELALRITLEHSWVNTGGSSGDEDELTLRIVLKRSWVNTGGSSGDEDELALHIALERSWVNTGGSSGSGATPSVTRRCRRRPGPPRPHKKPLEQTLTHITPLHSPFPNPFNP